MKSKQIFILLLALILPALVFVFLKMFGRNEFNVAPLFAESVPAVEGCEKTPVAPYAIQSETLRSLDIAIDSIACVSFAPSSPDRLARVREAYSSNPLQIITREPSKEISRCIFLLEEPFDIALVDRKGRIRGQYNSAERDEIDRLITEVAIIFRKY